MAIDQSSRCRIITAHVAADKHRASRLRVPLRWGAGLLCLAIGLAAYGQMPKSPPKKPRDSTAEVEQALAEPAVEDVEESQDEVSDEAFASQSGSDRPSDNKSYRMTFSPDPQVRRAALEAIEEMAPTPELRSRVKKMAESDENSVVRGYARLLFADWKPSIEPAEAQASDGKAESPRESKKTPALPKTGRSPSLPTLGDGRAPALGVSPRPRSSKGSLPGQDPAAAKFVPRASSLQKSKIESRSSIERASFEDLTIDDSSSPVVAADDDMDPLFLPDADDAEDLLDSAAKRRREPAILSEPLEQLQEEDSFFGAEMDSLFRIETGRVPLGFTGPSGILPTEEQESSHFVPIVDRWRSGFPEWDRYDKGHPAGVDYPYVEGHWWDPFNQNVLKGDYPIVGQHTFLNLTGVVQTFQEFRQLPTPATSHDSTFNPFTNDAFGNPNQYFTTNFFRLKADLFHGSAGFKQADWRIVVEGVFNMNDLDVGEVGVVNPDVRYGTNRFSDKMTLEQYFGEVKLADLSADFDFVSARVGSQPFTSDFRGFIFSDTNRGVRLFGTRLANRDQFNVIALDQAEKDTNSNLNTFKDRHQFIVVANYSRQDFLFPGYTAQTSFHYNHDEATTEFDTNNELVRPDPAGAATPHQVDAYYYGFAGDGHIGRVNISHAAYWVTGHDTMNPIAGRPIDISAQMAAAELSYDRDWVRFRTSYFYASGQHEANSSVGKGFDPIIDNPNFAGGRFSFWQRQPIKLLGVNLKQKESLVPDLRSSKFEGQSNFTNPGLQLVNAGMDFQVTPNCRVFTNANYLWFDATQALEQFLFQSNISRQIGTDLSIGTEYRPFLNDNVIIFAGYAALLPGKGLNDIYGAVDPYHLKTPQSLPAMNAVFLEMTLTY